MYTVNVDNSSIHIRTSHNQITLSPLTSSDDNSCDWSVGIETCLDDLRPTEEGVPLMLVRTVGGGVLGQGCLCHRHTLT